MTLPTISEAALAGLSYERSRVEMATLRIAVANASFASEAQAVDFLQQLRPRFPELLQSQPNRDDEIKSILSPGDPMADARGYIYRINVDPTHEMATLVSASRAYEANIRAYNVNRDMTNAALNIGGSN